MLAQILSLGILCSADRLWKWYLHVHRPSPRRSHYLQTHFLTRRSASENQGRKCEPRNCTEIEESAGLCLARSRSRGRGWDESRRQRLLGATFSALSWAESKDWAAVSGLWLQLTPLPGALTIPAVIFRFVRHLDQQKAFSSQLTWLGDSWGQMWATLITCTLLWPLWAKESGIHCLDHTAHCVDLMPCSIIRHA